MRRVADGEARDLRRRGQIPIEQRRLHRRARRRWCRSRRPARRAAASTSASISTPSRSRTALAYSVRLSRWRSRRPARIRMRRGGAIQLRLQPRGHGVVGGVVGPPHARRRHRAASQLARRPFPTSPPSWTTCSASALSSSEVRRSSVARCGSVTQYLVTSSRAGVARRRRGVWPQSARRCRAASAREIGPRRSSRSPPIHAMQTHVVRRSAHRSRRAHRHLFCAWHGLPSFGSAPCLSSISAPSLL